MKIVGCDLHTRYQQIAMLDDETGELIERRLEHASGEAKQFYSELQGRVRIGIEAGCPILVRRICGQDGSMIERVSPAEAGSGFYSSAYPGLTSWASVVPPSGLGR